MGKETIKMMLQLATSAFGLVAALAWNEAISTLVRRIFKTNGELASLFVYAVIITALAVFITTRLAKLSEKINAKPPGK